MNAEKTIRLQAKAKLRNNNWAGVAGAATLLGVVVMTALYLAQLIDLGATALLKYLKIPTEYMGVDFSELSLPFYLFFFLFSILLIPLFMGFLRYTYFIAKDGTAPFGEIFYYSGRMYGKGLGVGLGFILRNFWRLVVSFAPWMIANAIVSSLTADKFETYETLAIWEVLCYIIVYTLLYGGVILFARLSASNFLYFYLYFEDESLRSKELSGYSGEYMQNFTDDAFRLFMSVFPWTLLCIFVIPVIFVLPYIATVMSTSGKWLVAMLHPTATESTTDENSATESTADNATVNETSADELQVNDTTATETSANNTTADGITTNDITESETTSNEDEN